ncbi:unnamed protein product [Absidia cylindrospora]
MEPIAYRIKVKRGEFWLYDGQPKDYGRRELLHGLFDGALGFHAPTGEIRGYNTVTDFGPSGFFGHKLKFVDGHTGYKYKWKTDIIGSYWELKDSAKQIIASFECHKFQMSRQGRLTIHKDNIPEHLMALILLTHKLVHNQIKYKKQRRTY